MWEDPAQDKDSDNIAERGKAESYSLGERLAVKFKNLIQKSADKIYVSALLNRK